MFCGLGDERTKLRKKKNGQKKGKKKEMNLIAAKSRLVGMRGYRKQARRFPGGPDPPKICIGGVQRVKDSPNKMNMFAIYHKY